MSFKNFTLRYELVVNIEKKLIVVNNLELYNMPLTSNREQSDEDRKLN